LLLLLPAASASAAAAHQVALSNAQQEPRWLQREVCAPATSLSAPNFVTQSLVTPFHIAITLITIHSMRHLCSAHKLLMLNAVLLHLLLNHDGVVAGLLQLTKTSRYPQM
jgi:hypothetical protein